MNVRPIGADGYPHRGCKMSRYEKPLIIRPSTPITTKENKA